MKNHPRITVIIPVYNTSAYLPACLNSLLAQTFKDIEIVCVNDASTDNSLEILNQYADKHHNIHIITYAENKGQGYARNLALKDVKTPYVGFIDSDDTVDPNYYEYLYRRITEHDADISSARVMYVRGQEMHPGYWPQYRPNHTKILIDDLDRLSAVYANNNASPCKHLYRADFLQKHDIRFLNGLYHEDQYFMVKAFFYAQKIVPETLDAPRSLYYLRSGSSMNQDVSSPKYRKSYFDQFIVCHRILDFLKEQKVSPEIIRIFYQDFKKILMDNLLTIHIRFLNDYAMETRSVLDNPADNKKILKIQIKRTLKIDKPLKRLKKRLSQIKSIIKGWR